jgi:hypothetical protein
MGYNDIDWANILGSTAPQGVTGSVMPTGAGMFGQSTAALMPSAPAGATIRQAMGAQGMGIPQQGMAAAPAAPSGGGFFGSDGPGRAIAGSMGDYLLQRARMQPIYGPAMSEQRKQGNALAQALQVQAMKNAKPDDFSQRYGFLEGLRPGLGMTYADNYAANGGGQSVPQIVTIPGAGTFAVPKGGSQAPAAPAPMPAEINDLRGNPALANDFDQKFGAGAAAKILGGVGQAGPRTFP